MKTKGLTAGGALHALLAEVLLKQAPELHRHLLEKATDGTLLPVERSSICRMIASEFTATGLDANSEPTPRGEILEQLLDAINRPNIFPSGETRR
jgi:hypothetical protein